MKSILTFAISCIALCAQAQTWQLFPYLQQNHYQNNKSDSGIISITADSIKTQALADVIYFNQKTDPHPCFTKTYFLLNRFSSYYPDSVIQTNDTAKMYFGFKAIPFFKGPVGSSMNFVTFIGKTATIKLIAASIETVLENSDSVRVYELKNNGKTYLLKWSKTYGLLNYINPYELHESYPLASTYSLIGYKHINDSAGYQMPNTNLYMPYQPGNIYLWKYIYDVKTAPAVVSFYRDSIVNVIHTPEKISITSVRQIFRYAKGIDTLHNFSWEIPKQLWNIPAGGIGFLLSARSNSDWIVWNGKPVNIKSYDSATIRCFKTELFTVEDSTCNVRMITDSYYETCYCTGIGKVFSIDGVFYNDIDSLIGWKTPTSSFGSVNFPVGQEEIEIPKTQFAYPNPAHDILFTHPAFDNSEVEIFNLMGSLVWQQSIRNNQLNISNLNKGMYLLHIRTKNREYVTRFIKE